MYRAVPFSLASHRPPPHTHAHTDPPLLCNQSAPVQRVSYGGGGSREPGRRQRPTPCGCGGVPSGSRGSVRSATALTPPSHRPHTFHSSPYCLAVLPCAHAAPYRDLYTQLWLELGTPPRASTFAHSRLSLASFIPLFRAHTHTLTHTYTRAAPPKTSHTRATLRRRSTHCQRRPCR